jgi:hypothetical protein
MLNEVIIKPLQKVTQENFNNFGEYARKSFDVYTKDLFGDGAFFSGFNVVSAGSGRITVAPGRAVFDGVFYAFEDEGGTERDLIGLAPTSLSRWVGVYVYPDTVLTNIRPTEFLTNTTDRTTVSRPSEQESRRVAVVDTKPGDPSLTPVKPQTPPNAIAIAWCMLTPTGVTEIVRNLDAVLPSTVSLALRLAENDLWRNQAGVQLEALGSNISAIQSRLVNVPDAFLVRNMAQDLARVRERLGLPQAYTAYHSDYFLDASQSQIGHIDYLANVEEGVRFPPANTQDMQIGLLNPFDASVITSGGNIMPTWTYYLSISNIIGANDLNIYSIAQGSYQEIAYSQNGSARQRLRVGPYYEACSNWLSYYAKGATYDAANRILSLTDGEQLQVSPDVSDYQMGRIMQGLDTHLLIRMRQVWADTGSDEPYPALRKAAGTVNGSVIGQTFLNFQDGYIPYIGIRFASKGTTGDLHGMLCEVGPNGEPDLTQVIARADVPVDAITLGDNSTHFTFPTPVFVQKGKFYAFVIVTVGNHAIHRVGQSKIIAGTFFSSTDGRWLVPDQNYDMSIVIYYCQFNSTRVVVELNPLQLNGGMTAIDILAQMIVPNGSNISFEAMFNGAWTDIATLRDPATNPLNGLPPLLRFRAVFTGTQDIMPALGVGPNSRVRTKRPQPNFRHISTPYTPPAPVKTITIESRLEAWNPASHTFAARVRTGATYATLVAPTAVQDKVAPEDPRAIIRTSVFSLAATVPGYLIDMVGTTSNVVDTFHVANRTDVATNP